MRSDNLNSASTQLQPIGIHKPELNVKTTVRALLFLIRKLFKFRNLVLVQRILSIAGSILGIIGVAATFRYILIQNALLLQSLIDLKEKKYENFISTKKRWMDHVISMDIDPQEVSIAQYYSQLLNEAEQNNWIKPCARTLKRNPVPKSSNDEYKIYIYGPNSSSMPKAPVSENELWLTKMPKFDTSVFPNKRLFLNHFTLAQLDKQTIVDLSQEYRHLYVFSNQEQHKKNVETLPIELGGHLASPMALARILKFVANNEKGRPVEICGFDQYLSKQSYSGNVVTAIDTKNHKIANRQICVSLLNHDPLFNFLYIKRLIYCDIDNVEFDENLGADLSAHEYLHRLCTIKDFGELTSTK